MTKLTRTEIEVIARAVFAEVFEGSSVVSAPIHVVADSEWGNPDFVDVQIIHQEPPTGYDAQRLSTAALEIGAKAWALGDERFFGVSGNYSMIAKPAA
jgi:hypothetical protein